MQKSTYIMDKEIGLKIFVFPFSLIFVYAWFFIENNTVKLMLLPFIALYAYMIFSLVYVLFVEKKLKFAIDYDKFIWQEYDNGILSKKVRIYKKEIKHINFNSFYRNGMYIKMRIDITLNNDKKIILSDGTNHSLEEDYSDIFAQLTVYYYMNEFIKDTSLLQTKSFEKEFKNTKIFFIGLIRNIKRIFILFFIAFIAIFANSIINILSLKIGVFDTKSNEVFSTYKAVKLDIKSKREKVFFFEDYYYSLIKYHGKYIVLKQKEFSLDKQITAQWENSNYPLIFDEIKDLPNALELAKNLNNVTFRQLETWEKIFKSLWLINFDPPYFFKNSNYIKNLEKYLKAKEKKKELKKKQEKINKIKKRMKKQDSTIIKGLNKNEIAFIKKYLVEIYVLLQVHPIKRNLDEKYMQRRISDKYELFYENKKESSSKFRKSYLYLIQDDGSYINIFPKWAEKKLKKLANKKDIDNKIYYEQLKQKFFHKMLE